MTFDDGLERQPCDRCGRLFVAVYDWMRYCRVCHAERDGDLDRAFAEVAWQRGYALGLERATARDDAGLEAVLGELPLDELIALCHPDRHPPERFELANRLTVWLLGLRDSREAA